MRNVFHAILLNVFLTIGRIQAPGNRCLCLSLKHLSRHVFIAGGSGKGKTKLLVGVIRQLISTGCGFTLIEPHGDLTDETLDYLDAKNVDPTRVCHLRAGPESCFSLDPFADGPADTNSYEYEGWLRSVCDRLFSAFVRNVSLAEQEMMKLLKRWFKGGCYLCGLDLGGRHLGLTALPKLFQPDLNDFNQIIEQVTPFIRTDFGREVLSDFLMLRDAGPTLRGSLVGSTINLLRETLGTFTRQTFAQQAPSLSQRDVIQNRMIQLIDCRKDRASSREEGRTLGGLLLNLLIDVAERLGAEVPPDQRVPHYIIIDEAENFIGEDLRMAFSELRKFGIIVIIAVQDVSCLKKGELDLIERVVSQCGLHFIFQQKAFESLEIIGKPLFYTGDIDFAPVTNYQVLPDGFDWVETQSVSIGVSESTGVSRSASHGISQTVSCGIQSSESIQRSVSVALAKGATEGMSSTRSEGVSTGKTFGISESAGSAISRSSTVGTSDTVSTQKSSTVGDSRSRQENSGKSEARSHSDSADALGIPRGQVDGESVSTQKSVGSSKSESTSLSSGVGQAHAVSQSETSGVTQNESAGTSQSWNDGRSFSTGMGFTSGTSTTETRGNTEGTASQIGQSVSESYGVTDAQSVGTTQQESHSLTVTRQMVPLAKHKIIESQSGIKTPLDVQLAKVYHRLAKLGDRMFMAHVDGLGMTFLVRTHDIQDAYGERGTRMTFAERNARRRKYRERIHAAHRFYFVPPSISESLLNDANLVGPGIPKLGIAVQDPDELA